MALLRIETVEDPKSGRFSIEVYYPNDADRPLVTTTPCYASAAAAENDIIAIISASANNPGSQKRGES